MDNRFLRSEMLFGSDNMQKLSRAKVIVFGLGGVGGAAFEALVRAGIGFIDVVDKDTVDITNINRQLLATDNTVGTNKTDAAVARAKTLNPDAIINKYDMFYLPETADEIELDKYDYIIDCIDNVTAKLELISRAYSLSVPVISSMGTGNKVHPEMLKLSDIYKTSMCPLARVMRRELKARGIKKLKVVYSEEQPKKIDGNTPSSCSFVPPVAGFIIAGAVVRDILGITD